MGSFFELVGEQSKKMKCLWLLTFHCQVVFLQTSSNTNTRLFSGNQALDSGTLGFGLGVGAAVLGSSLINNHNNNPCGKRRRRDAQNKDTRFFLGGNNNCDYGSSNNNYPSNNYGSSNNYYPSNNHGSSNIHYPSNSYVGSSNNYVSSSNHYPSNNYVSSSNSYSSYPSNNFNRCECSQLSFTDHYGNVNGKCRSSDSGKGSWCYTTGWNSGRTDLQSSQKFPNNPWSYQACSYQRGK